MKGLFLLIVFFTCACSFVNEERTVAFVGDSLIEKWDVQDFLG